MQDKYIIDNCTVFKLIGSLNREEKRVNWINFLPNIPSDEIRRMRIVCVGIQTAIKRVNKF